MTFSTFHNDATRKIQPRTPAAARFSRKLQITMTLALFIATLHLAVVPTHTLAAPKPKISVCMDPRNDLDAIMSARDLASRIFSRAGIVIRWHGWKCPADAIQISLSYRTPRDLMPDAVAYALPRQGTQIVLFYDRLKETLEGYRFPNLLAHVVVHEITHLLQGVGRHSETGMMKAKWDWKDYNQMDRSGLAFTGKDIELIHDGLQRREMQLLEARQ